jgi:hypothetical protein
VRAITRPQLNFFLVKPPCARAHGGGAAGGGATLRYGLFGSTYEFELDAAQAEVAVLADFGTAEIADETMGQPIAPRHFTTLENTPPDFLLSGGARQGFEADCFALGLCLVHLLTGQAPYEELVEDLRCPDGLRDELHAVWCAEDDETFAAVREHARSDDDGVLADTLYRYICLFREVGEAAAPEGGAAWRAVQRWLAGKGRSRYAQDHAQWSIFSGRHSACANAQRRMARLPGRRARARARTHARCAARADPAPCAPRDPPPTPAVAVRRCFAASCALSPLAGGRSSAPCRATSSAPRGSATRRRRGRRATTRPSWSSCSTCRWRRARADRRRARSSCSRPRCCTARCRPAPARAAPAAPRGPCVQAGRALAVAFGTAWRELAAAPSLHSP